VHTPQAKEPDTASGWKAVWHGTRAGDEKEYFWLFSR